MIKEKDKIKIKLGTDGTLEVVCMPVNLNKDIYNYIELICAVPVTENTCENAMLKVWAISEDTSGQTVVRSSSYNLTYKETKQIGKFDYEIYGTMFPEEFCKINGDLKLTFCYCTSENDAETGEEIITSLLPSASLNMFVGGNGYNRAGVKISNYDAVAGRVNALSKQVENKADKSDVLKIGQELGLEHIGEVLKVDAEGKLKFAKIVDLATDLSDEVKAQIKESADALAIYQEIVNQIGTGLNLSIDPQTYIMQLELLNKDGTAICSKSIDLPLESMVVSGSYANGYVTLTLQNEQEISFSIASLVSGLVPTSRTINGKPLTNNITLSLEDLGASLYQHSIYFADNVGTAMSGWLIQILTNESQPVTTQQELTDFLNRNLSASGYGARVPITNIDISAPTMQRYDFLDRQSIGSKIRLYYKPAGNNTTLTMTYLEDISLVNVEDSVKKLI